MNNKTINATLLRLALLASLGSFAPTIFADTVTLANGDRLTGEVTIINGGKLLLNTEFMGLLSIPTDQVTGINKDGKITVKTAAGDELIGTLDTVGDQQVVTTPTGQRSVAVTDVTRAYADYVNAADLDRSWDTRLDLGFLMTRGNSDTQTASLHVDSIYKQGVYEHRGHLFVDKDEADDETTRDQLDAAYDFRWYYDPQWYALANVGYFKDKLKDIDRRVTVGLGVGHLFWDNSFGALSAELGISQVFEDLDGDSENNPAVRWALDYNYWFQPERLELFHNHEILKILDSDRGEILNASTGLRLHLSDRWNANVRMDVRHETEVPVDSHNSDITWVVGVGVLF